MHDRTDWRRGLTGTHKIKDREYKNLTEFSRPCANCGNRFSIFVTDKIAAGHADSNSFGLKNCEQHRRSPVRADNAELERLRMANSVMKQELEGLYARDHALFAELQECKARLVGTLVLVEPAPLTPKMPWE